MLVYRSTTKNNKLIKLAQVHYDAGRLKEALSLFRQVLDDEPKHLNALVSLTEMSLELGQVDGAASLILRALASEPFDKSCLLILDKIIDALEEKGTQAQLIFEYSQRH